MKKILIALMLAAAPLEGAFASPGMFATSAPQESDLAALDGVAYGTVELIQPAAPAPIELSEKADAALVRMDDGRSVTVGLRPLQHVESGERVRVLPGETGARIEPA